MEAEKRCCSFSGLCNSLIMCFYVYVQGAWLLAEKLSVETRELQKHVREVKTGLP